MTLVVRPASMALGMLILATTAVHGQAGTRSEEVLTNASVAQLVQSKLARKLIVAKIRDSRNSFDVSAVGLVALRAQDVPEEILGVMLESAAEAAARDALSNQGVVQMLDAKLSRDLVITKIRGATPNFDLTTSGLVSLQQRKVPRQVIEAMMLAGNSSSSLASSSSLDAEPPPPPAEQGRTQATPLAPAPVPELPRALPTSSLPTEPGIYVRGRSTSVSELVRLEPTAYTAGRTGNILGAAVTGGISKAKLKAVVRGSRAAVQVPEATEFYFVFDKTDQGMGPSFAWLSQITSPNEFSLIRFDVKTNSREVVVGAVGAYSRQSGTEDQAIIQFTLTRLAPGKYRVVPDGSIPIGQYAFITESGPSYGVAGNRVFDFGVTGRSTR